MKHIWISVRGGKVRNIYFVLVLSLALASGLAAQNACNWAVECGGMGCNEPTGIDTDIWGNIYVTGFFADTATFGPYTLTATTSVAGGANRDVFVAKLSPEGQFLWVARSFGTFNNVPEALVTDELGNTYITGFYQGSITFGDFFLPKYAPGNYNDADMFVAKLDTNGNWLWAEAVGSTCFERPAEICLDSDDNLYVCGHFSNQTNFGDISISGETSQGYFIAKANSDGEWQWVRSGGGMGEDYAASIAVDASGNVFAAGVYEFETQIGSWIFPGCANNNDVWFAKLDTDGNWLWAKAYSSPGYEYCGDVKTDVEGNCYMRCTVDDSLTVAGTTYIPVGRSLYLYIKHDPDGNVLSVSPCGSSHPTYYMMMPADATSDGENLYALGIFTGPSYWGDISLTTPLGDTGMNIGNKYVALLSGDGTWTDVYQYHVKDPITSGSICLDGNGGLLVVTSFSEYADFGEYSFSCPSGIDNIVIAKFNAITPNEDEQLPTVSGLQVTTYPNPFRDVVQIELSSQDKYPLKLEVYDLRGRKIREIDAEGYEPGKLSGSWNGHDSEGKPCANGIYLIRAESQAGNISQRVILMH